MPASFGVQGPGESTIASGLHRERALRVDRVVAPHLHLGPEVAEEVDRD